jgi:hypothetical protein
MDRNDLGFLPGHLLDDFQFTTIGNVLVRMFISRTTFRSEPL